MSLQTGIRLGPYEITAPISAGSKGEVRGVLWAVPMERPRSSRTSTTAPLVYSYWTDPSQNSEVFFDAPPDGRYLAFEKQTVLDANIEMIAEGSNLGLAEFIMA